jgi:molybdopterin molybdotransferase
VVSSVTVAATGDGKEPAADLAARDIRPAADLPGCDMRPAAELPARGMRLSGFAGLAEVSAAWAWLDRQTAESVADLVALSQAEGRVLADTVAARGAWPGGSRSAANGYAVRAADCDGANAYNPLLLTLLDPHSGTLAPGFACPVATGWTLPAGADAVLPYEAAQPGGAGRLEVLAPVAPGTGTEPAPPGAGKTLLQRGRRLRPQDVAYLAALGVDSVPVLRRPRIGIVVPGAKSGPDALTPLLRALLARDAALVEAIAVDGDDQHALATALAHPAVGGCNLVLLAGRAGAGPDDTAAPAVTAAGGALALHGIALRPGGSAGLGILPARGADRGVPLVLLPGDPLACLVAYDILAARLVRRLAGLGSALPYPAGEYALARKIVSGIGLLEIVPVRLTGEQAQPIAIDAGLAGAVQADGFVVVAEAREGYRQQARVQVHLYDPRPAAAEDEHS